jgi:tRNA1Val (adenine37-N6)-methyltransferase
MKIERSWQMILILLTYYVSICRKVVNLWLIMSKDIFTFKQFSVNHGASSMRVGTDAVLLGSWAEMDASYTSGARVLDVGCGCGLIGMMIAQRYPFASVLGIDIDAPSVYEAKENAEASPFASRMEFMVADVRSFSEDSSRGLFNFVLCNPPYYTEDTLPPDDRRSKARNSHHLSFAELVSSVTKILSADGVFAVVIPMQARGEFVGEALKNNLNLRRECSVKTTLRKAPKRVLLEFDLQKNNVIDVQTIVLQNPDGSRSEEYSTLCKDFYL